MCSVPKPKTNQSSEETRSLSPRMKRMRFSIQHLKPFTYSVMHLTVAVAVAFALTRDWRIALGVGIIEPLVQTVAYTIHEAVWSKSLARRSQAAV